MKTGKRLGAALAGLLVAGYGATAAAAVQHVRVRGDIAGVHGKALEITTYNGRQVHLQLTHKTRYALVLPASLSDIKSGDFVGIGATGPDAHLQALEVVIFPAAMRGTGEGHYAWSVPAKVADADRHAATTKATAAAPPVHGTMTNGTVAAAAAPPVQGTMTNGTVAGNSGSAGGKELTVTYGGGRKVRILVPAGAPVVRLQVAHRAVLHTGAKAFAVASGPGGGSLQANIVAVGKNGMMPPM